MHLFPHAPSSLFHWIKMFWLYFQPEMHHHFDIVIILTSTTPSGLQTHNNQREHDQGCKIDTVRSEISISEKCIFCFCRHCPCQWRPLKAKWGAGSVPGGVHSHSTSTPNDHQPNCNHPQCRTSLLWCGKEELQKSSKKEG